MIIETREQGLLDVQDSTTIWDHGLSLVYVAVGVRARVHLNENALSTLIHRVIVNTANYWWTRA